jgi:DNA-binding transcriptional ArsR family regulator
MGLTKTTGFEEEQLALAALAKALAHPARIAIIQHLLKVNQCIGGQIVDELPLAQPTVSRHLKELKDAGIIKGDIDGVRVNYCIDAKRWKEIRAMFNGLFDNFVADRDCC